MFSKDLYEDLEENSFQAAFFVSDVAVPFKDRMRKVSLMGYRMDAKMLLDVASAYAHNHNWRWNSIVITDYRYDVVAMRMSLAGSISHARWTDWNKEKGWQS